MQSQRLRFPSPWSFASMIFASLATTFALAEASSSEESKAATHKQSYTIKPEVAGRKITLQTFSLGPRGNLWMACKSTAEDGSDATGLIMVYDPSGLLFNSFALSFVPQAINFSPKGRLYVAGSGKVARLALNGRIEIEIDSPNIGNREEVIAKARKDAEEKKKKLRESIAEQNKKIEQQIAKLTEASEDETEKDKTRRELRLKVLQQQLKSQSLIVDRVSPKPPTDEQILQRLMNCTAIAATDNEVYVACSEQAGYGYGVWRLSPDLTVEDQVIKEARGCCGQFDIQTDGKNLILAENTKFEVGFYDRNGKRLSGFGKRASNSEDGFGSCCNPMNVRCRGNDEILTAESSIGHIKRYSTDGEFLGLVGTAKVAGGCKHVAIGFDPDRNVYYMMNKDLSHVAVLVLKEEAPEETDDERLSREAMEGLGKKLIGTWDVLPSKSEPSSKQTSATMASDRALNMFGHIEFAPDGAIAYGPPIKKSESSKEEVPNVEEIKVNNVLVPKMVAKTPTKGKWSAVRQDGKTIEFVTIVNQVSGYGASVEILDEDTAQFSFFYGTPESKIGTHRFKRTSYDACGQSCSEGKKCAGEACIKDEAPVSEKASNAP